MKTTRTRRTKSKNRNNLGPTYLVSRIKRLIYSLGIIGATLGLVSAIYWRETLSEVARTSWETAGIQLMFLCVWLVLVAASTKLFGYKEIYRRWRLLVSSFIVLTAISLIPSISVSSIHLFGQFETTMGKLATGNTTAQGIMRIAVLIIVASIIMFPHASFKLSVISANRFRQTLSILTWLSKRLAIVSVRSIGSITKYAFSKLRNSNKRSESINDFNVITSQESTDSHDPIVNVTSTPSPISTSVREPTISPSPRSTDEILESIDPFAGVPSIAWKLPPLKLLNTEPEKAVDEASHKKTAESIEATLADYGVEGSVTEVRPGPTVTLYGVRPGWNRKFKEIKSKNALGKTISSKEETAKTRVKVDRIAALDKDLALQLKATSIRIDAPIPGTDLVGIEVPNESPTTVFLRNQLSNQAFGKLTKSNGLPFALGKGSGGEVRIGDLTSMPHLLVAGATGSGKSVFVNSFITSLLTAKTPQEVRFVMIDPKRVELTVYNGIPHLITPVIVETNEAVNALRWLLEQMDHRLEQLASNSARDIRSFNDKQPADEKLPYLVLIIDELADLMLTSGKSIEQRLVRLAQMGRATGIHLLVATQRPSVDVVTGLIKANFPARISFNVTSLVDSRTILDAGGAEKLLGKGDMLYLPQDASKPTRIQGSFLSETEAEDVVHYWKQQSRGYIPPSLPESGDPEDIISQDSWNPTSSKDLGSGEIAQKARELAEIYGGKISTSLLQRRLGIGYPRAARLKDQLVEEGLASANIPNAPAETRGRGTRRS